MEYKTEKEKRKTARKIQALKLQNPITIYRGVGDKSNPNGYSYTLSKDIAKFFAFRHSDSAKRVFIREAKIEKKDIIEYISDRDEQEILLLPEMLLEKRKCAYLGIKEYMNAYPALLLEYEMYKTLRSKMMEKINKLYNSDEHDEKHMLRVLLLTLLLSNISSFGNSDYKDSLCIAAMFHDIGRVHDDTDTTHGKQSYDLLCKYYPEYETNTLLEKFMTYHCQDNIDAFYFDNPEEFYLYRILKDADILDRQRFGIRALNSDYLHFEFSEKLSFAAFQLLSYNM